MIETLIQEPGSGNPNNSSEYGVLYRVLGGLWGPQRDLLSCGTWSWSLGIRKTTEEMEDWGTQSGTLWSLCDIRA